MDVPRLKWRQGGRGYIAYPVGDWHDSHGQRCAEVWLLMSGINTDRVPHQKFESWSWAVRWQGWFAHHGFADSKQGAADRATEAWWKAVQTELPRNVELEVAMIVARAPVRPLPNSLLGEDDDFLRKVNWHLNDVYGSALKRDDAPGAVKELMSRLSEELYSRQLAKPEPDKPAEPAISGGYRRRRRR